MSYFGDFISNNLGIIATLVIVIILIFFISVASIATNKATEFCRERGFDRGTGYLDVPFSERIECTKWIYKEAVK